MSIKDDFFKAVLDALEQARLEDNNDDGDPVFQLTPRDAVLLGAIGVGLEKVLAPNVTPLFTLPDNRDKITGETCT